MCQCCGINAIQTVLKMMVMVELYKAGLYMIV